MDDPLVVGGAERPADCVQDLGDFIEAEAPAPDARRQAFAFEPLHDEVAASAFERAEGEDVDDVRVANLIDRARLLHEPFDRRRVGAELARDHLDSGLLADERVDRGEHLAHSTRAEVALYPVVADHCAWRDDRRLPGLRGWCRRDAARRDHGRHGADLSSQRKDLSVDETALDVRGPVLPTGMAAGHCDDSLLVGGHTQ